MKPFKRNVWYGLLDRISNFRYARYYRILSINVAAEAIQVFLNLKFSKTRNKPVLLKPHYTPGIYAEGYIVFAFPFVRSYVRSFVCASVTYVEFTTKFFVQVSQVGYISLTTHHHIWTIGTLEGRLSFHDSWPLGPCPRVGLEVKI